MIFKSVPILPLGGTMAKEQEWTPWYSRKEYKGNLAASLVE